MQAPPDSAVATREAARSAFLLRAGLGPCMLEPLAGDASFRRYYRLGLHGRRCILMDAPPPAEDCRPWLDVGARLARAGVRVPAVLAADVETGFLLLEDLGSATLLDVLDDATAEARYGAAMDTLLLMQRHAPTTGLPAYDAERLAAEMDLFRDWLMGRHLGVAIPADDWCEVRAQLVDSALAQPVCFVHRDYHSRNLMAGAPTAPPGVLDFQDAVVGPVTYDLVSLLRDCYVRWPEADVRRRALVFREQRRAAGLPAGASDAEWLGWFDRMGVQRHLKAAGIFCRLWHRDGKPGYLADLPRVLDYLLDAARDDANGCRALRPVLAAARAALAPA